VTTYPAQIRSWTRHEYHRLDECGILQEDEPVELIGGQLIVAEPKHAPHPTAVAVTADALRAAFGAGWIVRQQDPIALADDSEPEPDVFVAPGAQRDYQTDHPARPVLVVEIADSSLRFDRRVKGSLYARAGLADYWIVNLRDRRLEVYRAPAPDARARFGARYLDVRVFNVGESVAPLAAPGARVAVADLLP
jgi:Uma2 family endonuclease